MTTTAPLCSSCPLVGRLERAKACFRAQRDEIARLRDLLTRFHRIGVRRLAEKEPRHFLVGTDTLYQNRILTHALAQRDRTIQQQARVIATLKTLLAPGGPPPAGQEVLP